MYLTPQGIAIIIFYTDKVYWTTCIVTTFFLYFFLQLGLFITNLFPSAGCSSLRIFQKERVIVGKLTIIV